MGARATQLKTIYLLKINFFLVGSF